MALERKDNIGDTTTSTGTGTINLEAVAQAGARIFAGNVTSLSTVRYEIRSSDNTEWEIGEGIFTDGTPDTLTRVTVFASSNSNNLVSFSAGTKNVSLNMAAIDVNSLYQLREGQVLNGKISVTDTGSGLTLALKGGDGNDPSASNPVYAMIAGTLRTVTAALSVTKADGTNWCNAGSSELATKEIDYFAYLGYNATDGVVIGFSRIPSANQYSDFSTTTTNEKYCAISTITNASSTDYYTVIGRFAATLSATAAFTWSVPTYTAINLIQRPIYETRWLDILPVFAVSGGTAPTYSSSVYKYKIIDSVLYYTLNQRNTSGGTAGAGANPMTFQTPFDPSTIASDDSGGLGHGMNYESGGTICGMMIGRNSANKAYGRNITSVSSITGADQSDANRIFQAQGFFIF